MYKHVRDNKESYDPALVGYVGFALSYSGKWFGGWCRDSKGQRDYVSESFRNAKEQFPKLSGVMFENCSYDKLDIPKNSTIYCDPPYKGTTEYKNGKFDHDKFYDWCIYNARNGCKVFVSEYAIENENFKKIWSKSVNSSLTKDTGGKTAVECLFKVIV